MNVTITIEIPVEKLTDLQTLLNGDLPSIHDLEREPVPVPEEPAVVAVPNTPAGQAPAAGESSGEPEKSDSPVPEEPVTKSMIRAMGLELTQAGKKAELEAVFKKFGAAKLRDLKEEDYAEAYRLLGEL